MQKLPGTTGNGGAVGYINETIGDSKATVSCGVGALYIRVVRVTGESIPAVTLQAIKKGAEYPPPLHACHKDRVLPGVYQLNDAPTPPAVSLEVAPTEAVTMIWSVIWALAPIARADLLL